MDIWELSITFTTPLLSLKLFQDKKLNELDKKFA